MKQKGGMDEEGRQKEWMNKNMLSNIFRGRGGIPEAQDSCGKLTGG